MLIISSNFLLKNKGKKNYFMKTYNCFCIFCAYNKSSFSVVSLVFALNNKLYNFEVSLALSSMTLLQFMFYLRVNHNFIINSVEVPRFCYHHLLSIAANCRMCLVEEVGAPKLIVACANVIKKNATYYTMNQLIRNVREHILEYLLLNHPLDCPICDQGGECDLQDITKVYGIDNSRYFNKTKKAVIFKDFSDFFIKFKMTRCIHCTRCIRFFTEILDINLLGLINRGFSMKVTSFTENLSQYKANAFGNVVDICPVGALTLSNTEDRIRAWELIQKYTVDVFDSFGSDIRLDWSGSDLFRVLPCFNQEVNDSWISDLTRFSYSGLKIQRLVTPFYISEEKLNFEESVVLLNQTDWFNIFNLLRYHFYINKYILKKKIEFSGLTGIFSDNKSILGLKHFLNYLGSSNIESTYSVYNKANVDFRQNYILNLTNSDWENLKILILIGINVRLESPLLFIKINKYRKKLTIFYFGYSLKVDKFVQHLGLGFSNLIKFFEGKHYLSNFLLNALKHDSKYFAHFLIGNNVVKRADFADFLNSLDFFKSFSNLNIDYGVVLPFLGRISGSELGILPSNNSKVFINYLKNKNNNFKKFSNLNGPLYYNLFLNSFDDYDDFLLTKLDNFFSIYIGSHLDDKFDTFFNVVLPSLSFLEKSTSYVNLNGLIRYSNIVSSNLYGLSDNVILSMLFKNFLKCEEYFLLANTSLNNLYYINSFSMFKLIYQFNLLEISKKFFNIRINFDDPGFLFFDLDFTNYFIYNIQYFDQSVEKKDSNMLFSIEEFVFDDYFTISFSFIYDKVYNLASFWLFSEIFYYFLFKLFQNYFFYLNLKNLFITSLKNKFFIFSFLNNKDNYYFFYNYFNFILLDSNVYNYFYVLKKKKFFFYKEYFFNYNFSTSYAISDNLESYPKDGYLSLALRSFYFYNKDIYTPLNDDINSLISKNTYDSRKKYLNYSNIFFSSNLDSILENKLKLYSNLFYVENQYFLNNLKTFLYLKKKKDYYFWKSFFKYDVILPIYRTNLESNHISKNSIEIQAILNSYKKSFSNYK